MIKLIASDMDGTLLDSSARHEKLLRDLLARRATSRLKRSSSSAGFTAAESTSSRLRDAASTRFPSSSRP